MNYVSTPIALFERNKAIEVTIDRKAALHYIRTESITLFFDVLSELITEFNNKNDRLSLEELNKYIRSSRLTLETHDYESQIDVRHPFNNQEVDYLKSAIGYLRKLRESSLGKNFNLYDLIDYIKGLNLKNVTTDFLNQKINQYLSKYKFIHYYVNIECGNLYIYFHGYDYCISVIFNSNNFVIADRRWMTSLIAVDDVLTLACKLKDTSNVLYLYYIDKHGLFNRLDVKKPFDWYLRKIDGLLYDMNHSQTLIYNELWSARELASSLNCITHEYQLEIDSFKIDDIKLLRHKLMKVLNSVHSDFHVSRNVIITLKFLIDSIPMTYNIAKSKFDLRKKISIALSEIRKNNTLYIVSKGNKKNEDYAFGEENLTAILASNLRCLYYQQKNVSVYCEAMVGNGRSDVCLSIGGETFGLIEAKLINKNSNVESETRNAIDQLFSRYSENESIDGSPKFSLYLIIFAYDKDFKVLAKSIQSAILSYSERNGLVYDGIKKTENGIKFLYKERRSVFGFMDKVRVIDIMVCNMEIDYKTKSKQRVQNKSYNPTHNT